MRKKEIHLLGTNVKLIGKENKNNFIIEFPENVRNKIPNNYAWVLKFS